MYKFSMGKRLRVRFVVYWLAGGKVHSKTEANGGDAAKLKDLHAFSWMVRETVYSNGFKREAVAVNQ